MRTIQTRNETQEKQKKTTNLKMRESSELLYLIQRRRMELVVLVNL